MELQENLVVADRFRLVRMIGRGGMGSVWQAVHVALDQPCAVKFIEGQLGNVADAHARFEREAKAAAALRSPHVVQILDHGVWAERPYIAMELLEGEDLGKYIARSGGVLPAAQIAAVVEQVCRALTRAHAAGFVHRDLKPDNIFLVNDDDRMLVKILDFGVAKQTSQAIDGSNTKTGAMLGTPYYMSPEQAQGIKSVDARSDLWSLAVIVFQCLTGRLPFESEALGDLLVKIIVQPVPVPSQYAAVPPGFDAWWRTASDRNPDGRFPTAKEFSASLALAARRDRRFRDDRAPADRNAAGGRCRSRPDDGDAGSQPFAEHCSARLSGARLRIGSARRAFDAAPARRIARRAFRLAADQRVLEQRKRPAEEGPPAGARRRRRSGCGRGVRNRRLLRAARG